MNESVPNPARSMGLLYSTPLHCFDPPSFFSKTSLLAGGAREGVVSISFELASLIIYLVLAIVQTDFACVVAIWFSAIEYFILYQVLLCALAAPVSPPPPIEQ